MSNEYKLSQSSNKFNITHQASLQIEQDFQLVPHHTTNINGKKKKKKKKNLLTKKQTATEDTSLPL